MINTNTMLHVIDRIQQNQRTETKRIIYTLLTLWVLTLTALVASNT